VCPQAELPCGHRVCADCIAGIAEQGGSGRRLRGGRTALACPLCRQRVSWRPALGPRAPGIGDQVKVQYFVQDEVQSFRGAIVSVRTSAAGCSSDAVAAAPTVYYTVAFPDDSSTHELKRDQFEVVEHRGAEQDAGEDVHSRPHKRAKTVVGHHLS
jgi:hypothetical protein